MSGVEVGLEGALSVTRGDPLRWIVVVHDVVGLSDLRPSPGARLRVTTSLPGVDPIEVTADARGRATLEVPVPVDAPDGIGVVLEAFRATHAGQPLLKRRFELTVTTLDPRVLTLDVGRRQIAPGGSVRAWGRLANRTSGHPIAAVPVQLVVLDGNGRPVVAPVRVPSDASGLFAHVFRVPARALGCPGGMPCSGELVGNGLSVRARVTSTPTHVLETTASVSVARPQSPGLLVAVAPSRVVVQPGTRLPVDVVVRTPEGVPVAGARVQPDGMVPVDRSDEAPHFITDARGRVHFDWPVPDFGGDLTDIAVSVSVVREGVGSAQASAPIRVARVRWAGSLAAEGGIFPEAIGGRIWARIVSVDGHPAPAGVPVTLSGPRIVGAPRAPALQSVTDADGVAAFDVPALGPPRDDDPCGAGAATSVTVQIGAPNEAASVQRCIPLDPDAAARVRVVPSVVAAGAHVRVELTRAPTAATLPIAVTLLVRDDGGGMRAVSAHVVDPRETITELTLPPDVTGQVIVRARALHGPELMEVRGGMTSLWVTPGARDVATVSLDGAARVAHVAYRGEARGDRSALLYALPLDEARALETQLRGTFAGPLGDLRMPAGAAGNALVSAALAVATPVDVTAPALLRGATVVPVPAPESPEQLGSLRDPWRQRARFTSGRMALVLRALEEYVDQAVPARLDDVATQTPRGWDFNALVLDAVAHAGSLGDAGATGLGGEALSITRLRQLDPALTYDNVARRLTRKRLFVLMLALRAFVQQNGLDLRFAVRGDPTEWLRRTVGMYTPEGASTQVQNLVDAWGRPFVLRLAPGGRPRFASLVPVAGYELVSGGPNGRVGDGDDVWDPTARVLPPGLYAQAVGEDALVARLRGVELGRATAATVAGMFGVGTPYFQAQNDDAPVASLREAFGQLPAPLELDELALALRRPAEPGDGAGGLVTRIAPEGATVGLALDEEPRTWGVVAISVTRDGFVSIARGEAPAGAPLLALGRWPERLRAGEPVTLRLVVVSASREPASYTLRATGDALLGVAAEATVGLPPEESRDVEVTFTPRTPGTAHVSLALVDAHGTAVRTLNGDIAIDEGRHPLRRRATGFARAGLWHTEIPVPADAARPEGRLVLLAPFALAEDPDLGEMRERDPALVAWSETLAGATLGETLRSRLLGAQRPDGVVEGREPALSTAAAIVAFGALGADDEDASAARARAVSALPIGSPFADPDPTAGVLREEAALLAALATGGAADPLDDGDAATDPVARDVAVLRLGLRSALRHQKGEPTLLARAAAGLLTADPRDGHGLAMLELAAAHLENGEMNGALVTPTATRGEDGAEKLSATLALALAAHQAGRVDLRDRLLRGVAAQASVVTRLGGEPLFWWLACGAYGALGTGEPHAVVELDGRATPVTFDRGRAIVPLTGLRPGATAVVVVRTTGEAGVVGRAEAVFGRPFVVADGGLLTLTLAGDPGDAESLAALELTVEAKAPVRATVVDVQLPAGVLADEALLESLRGAPQVASAESREPGFVRLVLTTLARGDHATIPLPLRWTLRGALHGLGVVAYPAAQPSAMTTLAPRALTIAARAAD